MPALHEQVHVHVRSLVNSAAIREDVRNGRKVIVVPSATLPDNVVMNGIKYPADEIENSYLTLNRAPAPAGHPMLNGVNVSAYDPEAQNHYGIGAWNENVRRENGRVFLDKVIDVERANASDKGREILNAIDKGAPIHTSTGLTATLTAAEDDTHEYVARNIVFDHDAILLHEEGAATPSQGVGMLVNGKEIEVINSSLDDDLPSWAALAAQQGSEVAGVRANRMERILAAMAEFFSSPAAQTNSAEQGEADMADDKRLEQLEATVGEIGQSVKELTTSLTESIANAVAEAVAPATEMVANMKREREEAEQAELDTVLNKLVEAGVIEDEDREQFTLNTARVLEKKLAKKKGAVKVNANTVDEEPEDEFADYDPNNVVNAFKKEA